MKLNSFIQKAEPYLFISTMSLIIYVLIYNLFHYDPIQGYDGTDHHAYVQNFLNIYIPGKTDQLSSRFTYEFFSPPLPYLFPTFINEICKLLNNSNDYLEVCQNLYGFINIAFLSIIFVGLLVIYMKIIKIIFNNKRLINTTILLSLAIFSSNYKAIAMIRAEVYILFLNGFLIYRFLLLIENSFKYSSKDLIIFGSTIGLLALSRQWAFLLFPAYFIFYFFVKNIHKAQYLKFIIYSFFIGLIISGWFYISLYLDYGSFTTFNRTAPSFSLSNQPISFYFPVNTESLMVFQKPIRPFFQNQFLPILYSDLWGDYWGYFSFTSRSLDLGRNQANIGDYLARINIISIFPTVLLLIGVKNSFKSLKANQKTTVDYLNIYLTFSILVSFIGYLLFLVSFPNSTGDTNKAAYIIHLFHLMGLCLVFYLEKIKEIKKNKYLLIVFFLFITFIHNLSGMMSHFPMISIF